MKNYNHFFHFLDSTQIYRDLIFVASDALKYIAKLTGNDEAHHISNTLNFTIEHLQRKIITVKSSRKIDDSQIIDFFDNSQIYLDILATCYEALNYYFNLVGNQSIKSVSITINFAIEQLVKDYHNYSRSISSAPKSNKGGGNNEK